MGTIDKDEFLKLYLLDDLKFELISSTYGIKGIQLSEWWNNRNTALHELIQKSNQIYSAKKNNPEYKFKAKSKREFFEWYQKQPSACGYCGIEEKKVRELFGGDKPFLKTKRGRGKSLELERRDSLLNEYSEENCILACYLCNNHKSDLISEEDHKTYFANQIRRYLEDKYSEMKKK